MLGRYLFLRLRRALLPDFQRLWNRDLDASLKNVHDSLTEIKADLAELRRFRTRMVVRDWTERRAPLLAQADGLSAEALRDHITRAIADAEVHREPTTHLIVERLLPGDFYQLLDAAIPPAETFSARDPVKQDFEMAALGTAPELTRRVWQFFDEQVVGGIVAPALFTRFREAVVDHYAETGGAAFGERAAAIPHRTVAGRIQLRRPGYRILPHLDPKRVAITGLMYFPRPGDAEEHGTQLFRVDRPFVASGMKTFFPEAAGLHCELARTVPYRPNTMLAFVNAKAAHGATLPADARLDERYAYQFYVKPIDGELITLLRGLPPDAQAAWGGLL